MTGIRVVQSKADLHEFVELPYAHYQTDPHFVPPLRILVKDLLDRDKHPFYKKAEADYFLAERNGRVAGRIAAIKSETYISHSGNKSAFFGFFECEDDPELAALMFRVAEDWARNRGLDSVIGPMSPNMMGEMGFLVDGFDRDPAILMPYNKPYYDRLVQGCGYAKEMDLLAYRIDRNHVNLDHLERGNALVRSRYPNLSVRPVDKLNYAKDVAVIGKIFNAAWAENWGFAPLSKKEFEHLAADLKLLINFNFAHIAEDKGKPVAFCISLPDYNTILKRMDGNLFPTGIFKILFGRKNITGLRTALMGVLPDYQGKGIDSFVTLEGVRNGLRLGYQEAEFSWLLETNTPIISVVTRLGATPSKRYRTYKKIL